jgi:hypothetical protein
MSWLPTVRTTSRSRAALGRRGAGRAMALIAAMAAAAVMIAPAPVQAAPEETKALCYVDVPEITVTPGFSATPATGTGTSGPGATIRCVGKIRGADTVGDPGPLTVTFSYGTGPLSSVTQGDTCLLGSGDGTVSATVPMVDGNAVVLEGPIHFGFLGPVAGFHGHFGDLVYAGIGEPLPDLSSVQDCITTPITKFSIRGQFGMKNL